MDENIEQKIKLFCRKHMRNKEEARLRQVKDRSRNSITEEEKIIELLNYNHMKTKGNYKKEEVFEAIIKMWLK